MADYSINAVPRKVSYTGSAGVGPYAFAFEVLTEDDVAVYFNETQLTKTTDFTVTVNVNGTGSVTLITGTGVPSTPDADDLVVIVGARDVERTTDFVTAGDLRASALNEQLDALTIMVQQVAEEVERSVKAPVFDPTGIQMILPKKSERVNAFVAFDGNGDISAAIATDGVTTLAEVATDIATLADIEDGTVATDTIQTVSAIATDVTTVSGIAANVTATANNATNINTVASDLTGDDDIGTVAGSIANVNATGISINNVNTVANNIFDVNTVAGINTDITTVVSFESEIVDVSQSSDAVDIIASDLAGAGFEYDLGNVDAATTGVVGTPDGYIITVFNIRNDIVSVSDIDTDVTTIAGISADVTTVAGIADDVVNFSRTDQEVRDLFSGNGDLTYNPTIGEFSVTTYKDNDVEEYLSGGTGVTYNSGNISIGQDVGTTADVTFNSVTADEIDCGSI